MRVLMVPGLKFFRSHESGIKRVAEAYCRYLPEFGIEIVPEDEDDYDIKVVHAGMAPDCDVAHLHGLYWTADYEAAAWEWKANASVIKNIRGARQVTVPSEWVAMSLKRDMHLSPHVISHGIEWDEWAHHDEENGGYVIWNKNRNADVCDPWPMSELAKQAPGFSFISTFAPPNAPDNVDVIGLQPYEGMKVLVQGAAIYLSTTKETFGIGLLEAMASGVPVVGFDWGNISQLIEHKVSGWLSPAGDIEDMKEGLAYCWEHREAMGAAGREMARAYNWYDVCEKVVGVYEATLKPEPPTVGIVIPSYNYADKVGRAIESALGQDYELLTHVIVVDDGSDDGGTTRAVVEQYDDDRLQYIRQENQGVAAARNTGIAACDTKYIACLDADDAIEPTFIPVCVDELEKDRMMGITYTGMWVNTPDGKQGRSQWPDGFEFELQLKRRNQIPTCCVFRREAWERLGGYRSRYCPQGAGSEDAEFWTRFGAYGYDAKQVTKEPLFVYSWLSGNVGKKVQDKKYSEPDWLGWHPWTQDRQFPFASIATPRKWSHPVRSYDLPWVSVVIPVGPGHQQIVIDALDSLEAQTFRQWEAILVNDTGEPLPERLTKAFPFLTILETSGSMGAGYARNRGIEVAKAPFITFLDADDYLQPDFVRSVLEARLRTGYWVYTDLWSLWPNGEVHAYEVDDFDVQSLWKDGLSAVTALYTKKELDAVGGFNEEMVTREDWEIQLKLVAAGYCGVRVPQPLMSYRLVSGDRRKKQAPETAKALREEYSMEVLMAGCKKCPDQRSKTIEMPETWTTKEEAGFVQLEYTGKNRATTTWVGLTGRRYRFGNNEDSRVAWVHPEDVYHFIESKRFPFKRLQSVVQSEIIPGVLRAPAVT